ncbi:MAG: oligosaccharide flippase family protein [Anaerolineae bacterium]
MSATRARIGPSVVVAAVLLAAPLMLLAPVTLGGGSMVPYDALVGDPAFAPELTSRGIVAPQNGLVADLVLENVVWKEYIAASVRDGEAPLWNPLLFGGLPFLAAGQHSALHPSTVLHVMLDPWRAFGWNALLAMWLAGLSMFALGRQLGLSRFAALASGLAWSVGLPFVTNSVFPMIQDVMVTTPLVLAAIQAVADEAAGGGAASLLPRGRSTLWLIVLASATALTALAGHAEMLYYAAILSAAFGLYRLAIVTRSRGGRVGATLGLWLASAALVGAMVAGAQLVPLAELARANWRSGSEPYSDVVGYAFGLRQAATFIVPDFYGNPSHHAVYDIVDGTRVPLDGSTAWGTGWGAKNYVESAAYMGVLTLLLTVSALVVAGRRRRDAWFWAAVAFVSLLFVFGTPAYRIVFAGLPGFDQLHTPFRWLFPFGLATAMLAGLGADCLRDRAAAGRAATVGAVGVLAGVGLGVAMTLAFLLPSSWTSLVTRLFDWVGALDPALERFPDAAAFASYEFWNLTHLATFTLLSGLAIVAIARSDPLGRRRRWIQAGALGVLVADLWLVGFSFNPSVDPSLADVRPPVVEWLADATDVKWGRIVGYGSGKVLWPNTAMRFGLPDVRGYDSMIPKWTAETLNAADGRGATLDDPQARHPMFAYNRFGNISEAADLTGPAMRALGGRYVVTSDVLDAPGLELVYDGEARVYESSGAMPRAWLVNEVEVIEDRAQLLESLASFDPSTQALLEEPPSLDIWEELEPGRQISRASIVVREDLETRNSMELEVVGAPSGGMLVVSEGWFPGWRAWVRPAGADDEVEVPVYRADGALRAVPVPPGLSTVRLKYSPMSVKVGLYCSFLGVIVMLLAAAYALWRRHVHVDEGDTASVVAVNSAGPMAASLLNKAVDFVFAMLMLRVLGSENAGSYYFAISVVGFAEIFTNFGLNLLTAREVAKRPESAPRYLTNTSAVRILLWLAVLPMLAGYLWLERATGHPVGPETALAIALLAVALLPSNLSAAVTSVLQGREKMLLPAGVSIVTTLIKVSLGALVLLAGFGYVGLAGVAVVTNWLTFLLLAVLASREGVRPAIAVSPRAMWAMAVVSLPLMLNHLLQTVFFKIDVLLLRRIDGPVVVGWYSTAYKWIDALLIIPPAVTMALFPLLSRRAAEDREGMREAYVLAMRWLLMLALPIAAATTFSATLLVGVLGGSEYLPHGATALQIMIWFLPLSFVNGLTQYVLIALDRQRWITASFAVAATFNVVANVIVIPRYSYSGAAAVTIASEFVLLLPFLWGLRDVGAPPLLVMLWRPALATSVMALVLAGFEAAGASVLIGVPLSGVVYVAALRLFGALTDEDRALMRRMLPRRRPIGPSVTPEEAVDARPVG